MKPLRLASAACGAPRPVLNLTKALEDESGGESLRRRSLDTGTSSAQGVTSLERMMKLLMLHLFWTLGV